MHPNLIPGDREQMSLGKWLAAATLLSGMAPAEARCKDGGATGGEGIVAHAFGLGIAGMPWESQACGWQVPGMAFRLMDG